MTPDDFDYEPPEQPAFDLSHEPAYGMLDDDAQRAAYIACVTDSDLFFRRVKDGSIWKKDF